MGTIIPNLETFQKARQEIESGKISIRKASIKYGISRDRLSKSELSIPKNKGADPELIKSLHEKHGGNAYSVANELGVDHSSMAKRFVRMGLREEVTVYEQEITSQRLLITTATKGRMVREDRRKGMQRSGQRQTSAIAIARSVKVDVCRQVHYPSQWTTPKTRQAVGWLVTSFNMQTGSALCLTSSKGNIERFDLNQCAWINVHHTNHYTNQGVTAVYNKGDVKKAIHALAFLLVALECYNHPIKQWIAGHG